LTLTEATSPSPDRPLWLAACTLGRWMGLWLPPIETMSDGLIRGADQSHQRLILPRDATINHSSLQSSSQMNGRGKCKAKQISNKQQSAWREVEEFANLLLVLC
jgi:hypothetical protein